MLRTAHLSDSHSIWSLPIFFNDADNYCQNDVTSDVKAAAQNVLHGEHIYSYSVSFQPVKWNWLKF